MTTKYPASYIGKFIRSYRQFWIPQMKSPPYHHTCKVGNPVLRRKCEPIDPTKIRTPEMAKIIHTMIKVMRSANSCGIAAPQVGCPLQLFVAEFPEKLLDKYTQQYAESREFQAFELKVFINPKLTVMNSLKVRFPEGCTCLEGFSAVVPRFHEVKVEALNEKGEKFQWQVKGWPARILQHEVDHLEGKLYIDIMEPQTFESNKWFESELGLLQKLMLVYR